MITELSNMLDWAAFTLTDTFFVLSTHKDAHEHTHTHTHTHTQRKRLLQKIIHYTLRMVIGHLMLYVNLQDDLMHVNTKMHDVPISLCQKKKYKYKKTMEKLGTDYNDTDTL